MHYSVNGVEKNEQHVPNNSGGCSEGIIRELSLVPVSIHSRYTQEEIKITAKKKTASKHTEWDCAFRGKGFINIVNECKEQRGSTDLCKGHRENIRPGENSLGTLQI